MAEAIATKKRMEYQQLVNQFKLYKQTYKSRPLLNSQIDTYLQLAEFISRLAPTFLSHYVGVISPVEGDYVARELTSLFDDVFAKLKRVTNKLEKKQFEEDNKKQLNIHQLCTVCFKSLRSVEVQSVKEDLTGQSELSANILKMFKGIQQEGTFNKDEDKEFFKQLKIALEKKQEVLEICNHESIEFTRFIEDQLKELLATKEMFLAERQFEDTSTTLKGSELKDQVGASFKEHMNSKLPSIIKIVSQSYKRSMERDRRFKSVTTAVQTIEGETNKLIELKRKLIQAETTATSCRSDKQKLEWTVKQKELLISKIETELNQTREEGDNKTYELQKDIKGLDQKCKRYKQDLDKYKSRLDIADRQFKQSAARGQRSHYNIQNETALEQQEGQMRDEGVEDELDRTKSLSKKKKTLPSKGSTKFFLPTLSKTKKGDGQYMSKTEFQNLHIEEQEFNRTVKTQIIRGEDAEEEGQPDIGKKGKEKDKLSKTNLLKRSKIDSKKALIYAPGKGKSSSPSQSIIKNVSKLNKNSSKNKGKEEVSSGTKSRIRVKDSQLSLMTDRSLKKGIKVNQIPEYSDSINQPREQEELSEEQELNEIRASAKLVGNVPKDKKLLSFKSMNSEVSILQDVKNGRDNCNPSKIHKVSILKPYNDESLSYGEGNTKNKAGPQTITEVNAQKKADNEVVTGGDQFPGEQRRGNAGNFVTHSIEKQFSERNSEQKIHPKNNSYSLIKQDVDKENIITPKIGVESPYFKKEEKVIENIGSSLQEHLSNMLEGMKSDGHETPNIDAEQLKSLFVGYLKKMKKKESQKKTSSDQNQNYLHQSVIQNDKQTRNDKQHQKQTIISELASLLQKKTIKSIAKSSIYKNSNQSKGKGIYSNLLTEAKVDDPSSYLSRLYGKGRLTTEICESKTKRSEDKYTYSPSRNPYQAKHKNVRHTEKTRNVELSFKRKEKVDNSFQMASSSPKRSEIAGERAGSTSVYAMVAALKNDFSLFVSEQKCYDYEYNYSKKGHKPMTPLTGVIHTFIGDIFEKLEQLKTLNNDAYQQICSYLRYPFTNSQSGHFHIDIIKNMSLVSLTSCFQKIVSLHKKCRTEAGVCQHLKLFKKKIVCIVDKLK